ncbi:MAG: hypothetical protein HUJ80_07640 [Firmicutes bacterium]|nr:hypothetical protein [Bacillota bacterium]
MKRCLSLLLTATMLLGMVLPAFAEDDTEAALADDLQTAQEEAADELEAIEEPLAEALEETVEEQPVEDAAAEPIAEEAPEDALSLLDEKDSWTFEITGIDNVEFEVGSAEAAAWASYTDWSDLLSGVGLIVYDGDGNEVTDHDWTVAVERGTVYSATGSYVGSVYLPLNTNQGRVYNLFYYVKRPGMSDSKTVTRTVTVKAQDTSGWYIAELSGFGRFDQDLNDTVDLNDGLSFVLRDSNNNDEPVPAGSYTGSISAFNIQHGSSYINVPKDDMLTLSEAGTWQVWYSINVQDKGGNYVNAGDPYQSRYYCVDVDPKAGWGVERWIGLNFSEQYISLSDDLYPLDGVSVSGLVDAWNGNAPIPGGYDPDKITLYASVGGKEYAAGEKVPVTTSSSSTSFTVTYYVKYDGVRLASEKKVTVYAYKDLQLALSKGDGLAVCGESIAIMSSLNVTYDAGYSGYRPYVNINNMYLQITGVTRKLADGNVDPTFVWDGTNSLNETDEEYTYEIEYAAMRRFTTGSGSDAIKKNGQPITFKRTVSLVKIDYADAKTGEYTGHMPVSLENYEGRFEQLPYFTQLKTDEDGNIEDYIVKDMYSAAVTYAAFTPSVSGVYAVNVKDPDDASAEKPCHSQNVAVFDSEGASVAQWGTSFQYGQLARFELTAGETYILAYDCEYCEIYEDSLHVSGSLHKSYRHLTLPLVAAKDPAKYTYAITGADDVIMNCEGTFDALKGVAAKATDDFFGDVTKDCSLTVAVAAVKKYDAEGKTEDASFAWSGDAVLDASSDAVYAITYTLLDGGEPVLKNGVPVTASRKVTVNDDLDPATGLPRRIDMDALDDRDHVFYHIGTTDPYNKSVLERFTLTDSTAPVPMNETSYHVFTPACSAAYTLICSDYGYGAAALYDSDGRMVGSILQKSGYISSSTLYLQEGKTYVFAMNYTSSSSSSRSWQLYCYNSSKTVKTVTFNITSNVAADNSCCVLDMGDTAIDGYYGNIDFVKGKALIPIGSTGSCTVEVPVTFPRTVSYTVTPGTLSGYRADGEVSGTVTVPAQGEAAEVNVALTYTATKTSAGFTTFRRLTDLREIQADKHYVFAVQGSDGTWYALSAGNDGNTCILDNVMYEDGKLVLKVSNTDLNKNAGSYYVLNCKSQGTIDSGYYEVSEAKFETVMKNDAGKRIGLKLGSSASKVRQNPFGEFFVPSSAGGLTVRQSYSGNNTYWIANDTRTPVFDSGLFYLTTGGSAGFVIFTDADPVAKLDEKVTVQFHDYAGKVLSDRTVVTNSDLTLARFRDKSGKDVDLLQTGNDYSDISWSTITDDRMDLDRMNGTLYSFVGWTTDPSLGTFLSIEDSCDLYDTYVDENGTPVSALKPEAREKLHIIQSGNQDKASELINLALIDGIEKHIKDGVLDLYPVYAVRGYGQPVTSDAADGTPIVGVSDWKPIQAPETKYDKPYKEKWLGKIYIEVYKDGVQWGDTQPMYFRYHNDDAADLNLKFIDDALVLEAGGLYQFMSDINTFPATSQQGHYVLDAVYAEQGGSEDGLKLAYNWVKNNGGQLDNVKGGSTVKVYVTTVYQVEYFLNDVELSSAANDQPGNTWQDPGFYTTDATEKKFAEETAYYNVTKDNEYKELMNTGSWGTGECYVDDNLKRGDYSPFKYYINEYPHTFTLPVLPGKAEIPAGSTLKNSQWQMKDSRGRILIELDPESDYTVATDNTKNAWDDTAVKSLFHKSADDLTDTYHLYVYTKNYTPHIPDIPDTPDEPDIPDTPDTPKDPGEEPPVPGEPDVPTVEIPDEEPPKSDVPEIPTGNTPGEELPQTGMLWWPVFLMLAAGIFCMLQAIGKKNEEA